MAWAIRVKTGGTEASPTWTDYSTTLSIGSITMGYAIPRRLMFEQSRALHDADAIFTNNNRIQVSNDAFSTLWFDGWLRINNPLGVNKEGIRYEAFGPEQILKERIAKNNDSSFYIYNRNNSEDPQAPSDRVWTLGEIIIDRLEHMIGIPGAGSDISGHHDVTTEVTNTYIESWVINSYTAADILAFDLVMPEWEMNGIYDADFFTQLCEFYGQAGWYINPNGKVFVVDDLTTGTTVSLAVGESGNWIDKAGKGYNVKDNDLEFSLMGVRNTVRIEGKGQLAEVKPANIAGSGNPKLRSGGELKENWAVSGDDFEDKRYLIKEHDDLPIGTPNAQTVLTGEGPRFPKVYVGTAAGSKTPVDVATWQVNIENGEVLFNTVPTVDEGAGELLWIHYDAVVPFYVENQGGTSWDDYAVALEETIYDENLVHSSLGVKNTVQGYTIYGPYGYRGDTRDDTALMTAIAAAIVRRSGDEKVRVVVDKDAIDTTVQLGYRLNFANLSKWSTLNVSVVEITINPSEDAMAINCSNDIYRNLGYGELLRRMLIKAKLGRLGRMTIGLGGMLGQAQAEETKSAKIITDNGDGTYDVQEWNRQFDAPTGWEATVTIWEDSTGSIDAWNSKGAGEYVTLKKGPDGLWYITVGPTFFYKDKYCKITVDNGNGTYDVQEWDLDGAAQAAGGWSYEDITVWESGGAAINFFAGAGVGQFVTVKYNFADGIWYIDGGQGREH